MANETIFAVASFDKIQSYIDSGVLRYPAYVLCKDNVHKNNLVFIDKDLKIQPIKGYKQDAIKQVEELPSAENAESNVFYFCNGVGYLFVNNIPVPVFKDISQSADPITSYDQLTDIPVVNKYGKATEPVVVSELEMGTYSISGSYTIGGNLPTVFSTSRKTMFIVDKDDANAFITRFDGNKIIVYTVNIESAEVVQDKYATEAWIEEQGYITESYVKQAIDELYNRIANEVFTSITKVSQLENDIGYLTAEDINGIGVDDIADLF